MKITVIKNVFLIYFRQYQLNDVFYQLYLQYDNVYLSLGNTNKIQCIAFYFTMRTYNQLSWPIDTVYSHEVIVVKIAAS